MATLQIAFRTENEKDSPAEGESFFYKDNLFLVAEGVGGDYLGEMAREAAYKGIPKHFFEYLSKERSPGNALLSALHKVNEEILFERKKIGKKMAASVSVVYISGRIMHFCHLGDSRIYCLQRGEIVQLTRDHTVAEEDSYGEIGGQDPRILRALTDGLGIHESPDIEVKTFALRDKDIILMTTEGLTRYLSNMQILKLSMKQNGVKRLAGRLIEEAKRKGARNSMTLGVMRFREFVLPLNRKTAAAAAIVIALALAGGYAMKGEQTPSAVPEKSAEALKPLDKPPQKPAHPAKPSQAAPEKIGHPAGAVEKPPQKAASPGKPAADPARAAAPAPKPARPPEEPKRKEAPSAQEIHQFLREWKTAWENTAGPQGNIAGYMSFYSEGFHFQGLNKTAWRQEKAERNKKKQWIKVEIRDIAFGEPGPDNLLEVRFVQDYKSSNFSVSTNKSLTLKKGGSGWKIVSEKAL